ncbi:antibiotic biosynthesis monooxygenase [Halolamina sp. CBA1230]|uniref:putative quinol monooxygenase n=1 Tax=Halolamina sp. CBA1230 TaxID=1853690 RepID=UPI0009A231F5|nr:putative quinol monooxygenase [Halolamina sp. CBA1230]QKY21308.1 antibiotic biosynthesis monooxygenase [Halolamina sp. CBA1230]
MLVVHATFPIDPDKREEALDRAADLVEATREEPGAIEYDAATDLQEPTLLRFTEVYEDADAFAAHVESDHFGAFEAALPDLLAGEPEVMRYEVSDATELDV